MGPILNGISFNEWKYLSPLTDQPLETISIEGNSYLGRMSASNDRLWTHLKLEGRCSFFSVIEPAQMRL